MSKLLTTLLSIGAPRSDRRDGALIIPPSGHGSVGDEAMVMGLAAELHDAGKGPVFVLARGGAASWPPIPSAQLLDLPTCRLRKPLVLAKAFRRFARVYVVGADCIDGNYSVPTSLGLFNAAGTAAQLGAIATIVGSSFREDPAPECVEALKTLDPRVRVCSRDPRSHQRMQSMSGRSCQLVTDAAFLLRPAAPTQGPVLEDLKWIEARRSAGRTLLGVNFNRQVLGKKASPAAVAALLDAHAGALAQLLRERADLDIVLLPHDYRGAESDRDHAVMLAERLGQPERAIAVTQTLRANELKHIAGLMHLVLTGRMHLAIAALGSSVPVCCVVYQGKFSGLFDHFRLEPIVLSPDQVTDQSLFAMVDDALSRQPQLQRHIAGEIDRVRAMSKLNLGLEAASDQANAA
jgi:colanic acid/amylovoran biosynthesis protein